MFQTYLIVRGSMLRCHGHLFITSCCSSVPDSIPPSLMTFHVLQPLANPRIRHLRTVVISNPWPKNYFQYLLPTRHYLQWVCLNFPANCSMTLVRSGSSALVSATLTQWDKSATIFNKNKCQLISRNSKQNTFRSGNFGTNPRATHGEWRNRFLCVSWSTLEWIDANVGFHW